MFNIQNLKVSRIFNIINKLDESKKLRIHQRRKLHYHNNREKVLSGQINGIPIPFARFRKELPVIEQAKYYGITGNQKSGKCFGKDTEIVMYDGTIKKVQDIKNGELLLGYDSKPRLVQGVTKGNQEMFEINQEYGDKYVVNKEHILYLRNIKTNQNITITVEEFNKIDNKSIYRMIQSDIVEFNNNNKLDIDPYFYGLWLGDGDTNQVSITNIDNEIINYLYDFSKTINCKIKKVGNNTPNGKIRFLFSDIPILEGYNNDNIVRYSSCIEAANYNKKLSCYISRATKNNKTINNYQWRWINKRGNFKQKFKNISKFNKSNINPLYINSSIEDRYKLLAGILDSDGHKLKNQNGYDLTLKQESLINDISFICRSLGLRVKKTTKKVNNNIYYRIYITGNNCLNIPVKIQRKKCINNNSYNIEYLYRKFEINSIGNGDYYGFTVDKDHLFLLKDFTIVHNTQLADYLFLLHPIWFAYNNRDKLRVKIFYFSLEMSIQDKFDQFTCYWLYNFTKGRIRIDTKQLNSLDENNPVPEEVLELLESKEYNEFFDFIEDSVQFYENIRNPYGIFKVCKDYAIQNGTVYKKIIPWRNEETNEQEEREVFDRYEFNDPDEYRIVITDHISLLSGEKGMSNLRDIISTYSSKYNVELRNQYRYTVVAIQQQAAAQEGIENIKLNRVMPTSDGLADNKTTSRDFNVLIGIFSPYRFKLSEYELYDISKFEDNIRFMEVILNRNGTGGGMCPLYFDGAVNVFQELPLPNDSENLRKFISLRNSF